MTSKHLVDPEVLPALEVIPNLVFNAQTLPLIREGMSGRLPVVAPPEDTPVRVEELRVPSAEGHEIRLLVHRPANVSAVMPALFYIHGGGYVLGAPDMKDAQHRVLAVELGCVIFSVTYRLAPETMFPGAVEDCYAALSWIVNHAKQLGIDAARTGVMGESAGGGLAAGLALLVRDRAEFALSFQHLIYPMIDDRTCVSEDPHPYTGEFVWSRESNVFGWTSLLGKAPGGEAVSPYAAASRAVDLTGLPPSFISVGALDLFLEEDLEYARRLTRAGVPVELHVYPGAFHGFQLVPGSRLALAAERDSLEALRRGLHG